MIQLLLISILIFAPIAGGATRAWAFAPIQILTLSLGLFCIFKIFSEKDIKIKRTPLDIPILSFFFVFVIASFNSSYIYATLAEFVRLLSLAVIFYIVINFINKEREIKKLLDVILMTGTGIALLGILQYLGVIDRSWWDVPRFLSATYVNHNHFAGLMELCIPLCVGMILSEKEIGKKTMYVYSFLIMSIAFLLSLSRGGWLSLTVAMIFMFVAIFRKGRIRFALFMIMLLLITLTVFIFNSAYIDVLFNRIASYAELDLSGRSLIWKGTIGVIKDNWLLGTGPGSFIYNFPKYRPAAFNLFANFAHSDYLQVFSEMSIFGLTLMLSIIAIIIRKGFKTYNIASSSFKRWIPLALSTAILSLSIHAIADFNFYIPANALIFTVFSALIFNLTSKREIGYKPIILKHRRVVYGFLKSAVSITVAAVIVFMGGFLFAELCSSASTKALYNNEPEKAERMGILAARLCPLNYLYPYRLADVYSSKDDPEQAEKNYKQALRLNPMDAWSWIGLADIYSELLKASPIDQRVSELALSAYGRAVELDPLNSYYLKKFAEFLFNTGDSYLSSQMYRKASYVISSGDMPPVLIKGFIGGESYLEAADLALSSQDYNKALVFYSIAEGFLEFKEPAYLGQLRCYMKISSIPEAFHKFKETTSSRTTKSVLFAALSDYYLKKGYIKTAKRFSKKSILLDPKNPEGYQASYKLSKRLGYSSKEISKILALNNIPMSLDLKGGNFEIEFEIKKSMYSEGKFSLDVILPAGIYEFNVKARGSEAVDIWPHMKVRFNDKKSMNTYVDNESWDFYPGIVIVDYPINRFEIIFDNDYCDIEAKEDRNLYINSIILKAL
ncbi:MAG: O-antigen ligase family protein [Candidatus Omnitrophica bacterium]|nr:O-antigen ligase family protein [Candidatus Omnitrophota bacterium]